MSWALHLSDAGRVLRAVLDTDILFSRVLHDLFGRLALRLELFDLLWSDELLAEAERKLIEEKALSAEAAKVAGDADYLITRDQGYLPGGLRGHGVEVVAPDDLLCRALGDQPQAVLDVLELQAGEWGGGRPVATLLEAFERAGAAEFAGRARTELAGP